MSDVCEIVDTPNRENIKLHVRKVGANQELEETFAWLIEEMMQKGTETPRTLIFCTHKDDTGLMNAMLLRVLGSHYFADKEQLFPLIHVYHRDTTDATKDKIAKNMANPNGTIRVLLATSSAGMGVNFQNTTRVVNFGAPRDLDTLVQQHGRVGRCGAPSQAFLIYNARQLKKVEAPVLKYIKGDECRRKIITSAYMATQPEGQDIVKHDCCDICHAECKCDGTRCAVPEHPAHSPPASQDSSDNRVRVRESTLCDRELLSQTLENIQVSMLDDAGQELPIISGDLTHGLTATVIHSVMQHCDYIASLDDLLNYCNIFSYGLACTIHKAFQEVFSDMQLESDSDED